MPTIAATSPVSSIAPGTSKKRGLENLVDNPLSDQDKQPPKRTRSGTVTVSSKVSQSTQPAKAARRLKADSASWFQDVLEMLCSGQYGDEWQLLLKTWAAFEAKANYEQVKALGAKGRPKVVGDWVKSGRPIPWNAHIENIDGLAGEFAIWWAKLQPAWRLDDDGNVVGSRLLGDWEELQRPGLNGLCSVISCLWVWGRSLDKPEKSKAWLSAVKECQLVLQELIK